MIKNSTFRNDNNGKNLYHKWYNEQTGFNWEYLRQEIWAKEGSLRHFSNMYIKHKLKIKELEEKIEILNLKLKSKEI